MFHNKLVISFKILYYVMQLALKLSSLLYSTGVMFISLFSFAIILFQRLLLCFIGGQHDRHLPFWLPTFVKTYVEIVCFVCFAEINIRKDC